MLCMWLCVWCVCDYVYCIHVVVCMLYMWNMWLCVWRAYDCGVCVHMYLWKTEFVVGVPSTLVLEAGLLLNLELTDQGV